jgi:hypothetical protein
LRFRAAREFKPSSFSPAGLNRNSRLSTSFRFQIYSTRLLGMLLGMFFDCDACTKLQSANCAIPDSALRLSIGLGTISHLHRQSHSSELGMHARHIDNKLVALKEAGDRIQYHCRYTALAHAPEYCGMICTAILRWMSYITFFW